MSWLVLDSENSTRSVGDAKDQTNVNVIWSYANKDGSGVTTDRHYLQELIDQHTTIVGFNLAYDLLWLWRLGLSVEGKKLWDCQVAAFILSRQEMRYPSLDGVAASYGLPAKLDVVKTQYWDKGIDTVDIPYNVLAEYAEQDAKLTASVYLKQQEQIQAHQKTLFSITMQDLLVLAEMRHAGMKYDQEYVNRKSTEILSEIESIKRELDLLHNVPSFNWASGDHLSALLYGGEITEVVKVPNGVYKTGPKVGQPKFRLETKVHSLPRIYKPLPKTELAKGGVWSTSEDILYKIDDGSKLITGILKIRELSKLYGTYLKGIPEKAISSNWSTGMVYGHFNQCVAVTGRLSSSAPNLQNMPDPALQMIISRY